VIAALAVAAMAGTPAEELGGAWARGVPDGAVACAPLGRAMEIVSAVALPPEIQRDMEATASGRALLALRDPAAAAAAGLDLDGPIVLVSRKRDGVESEDLTVAFAGSPAQAEDFVRRFGRDPVPDAGGWRVDAPKGTARMALADGRLSLAGEVDAAPATPSTLLSGLPTVDGCVVWAELPQKGQPPMQMAAFVPLSGGAPATVHVGYAKPMDAALLQAPVRPVSGTSSRAPSFVATLGVPLDSALELLGKAAKVPDDGLSQLRKHLRFGPGATVAFFDDPRKLQFAARLPVTGPDGRPMARGKLARVAKRLARGLGEVSRVSPTAFRVVTEDRVFYVAATQGALIVGADAAAVGEAAAGIGEPWIAGEVAEWAGGWTMAVSGTAMPMRAGIRFRPERAEVELSMPPLPPEVSSGMLSMVGGMAATNFRQMRYKALRAEVPVNVRAIALAERAHFAENARYVAVPRADAKLGREPAPFAGGPEWTQLGWSPDGPLRGTYWVEVAGDGFVVHGAIDADGDGVPAEFTVTGDGEAVMTTLEAVY
jgi:hypothetical protein